MSILVGLNMEWMNCCGAHTEDKDFFEAVDIHDAAVKTLKCNWSNT